MRKVLNVFLVLTLTGMMFGQCRRDSVKVAVNGFLKTVPYAKIRVCSVTDTTTPCTPVSIYSDPALSIVKANPITADKNGEYTYCAATDNYNEQISGTNIVGVNNQPTTISPALNSGYANVAANGTSSFWLYKGTTAQDFRIYKRYSGGGAQEWLQTIFDSGSGHWKFRGGNILGSLYPIDLSLNGGTIDGLADPSNPQDAATKAYVDAHGGLPTTYLDTDTALTANSDVKVPSQKAVKTYVDAKGSGGINGVIDVTQAPYSAKCDGTTNDLAAFKSALAAAISAGKALYVPSGTCYIEFANSAGNTSLLITGTIKIFGAGRDLSILKFGPEAPPFSYYGLYFKGTGNSLVSDLTIQGPTDPGPNGFTNNNTNAIATEPNLTPFWAGDLTVKNVKITGKWNIAIQSSNGNNTLTFDNVDAVGYQGAATIYNGSGHDKYLNISNSYFHDSGIPSDQPNTSGYDRGHVFYMHPNISTRIVNTVFSNTGTFLNDGVWCMKVYATSTPSTSAKYFLISNSAFLGIGTRTAGFYLANAKAGSPVVRISNSMFQGAYYEALSVGWDMDVVGSTAIQTVANKNAINSFAFDGTQFSFAQGRIVGNAALGSDATNCAGCATTWTLRGNDITGTVATASTGTTTSNVIVENNTFRLSGNAYATSIDGPAAWDIVGNTFLGTTGVYTVATFGTGVVRLDSNKFLHSGPILDSRLIGDNLISGANNYVAGLAGSLIFRPTSTTKQMLRVREGLKPTTIASATNLSLGGYNWTSFHVTGTTQIDNIYFDAANTGSNNYFGGSRVCLIADGAWTTSAAGNISPKVTTARTAGQAACFIYDAAAAKWYEQ